MFNRELGASEEGGGSGEHQQVRVPGVRMEGGERGGQEGARGVSKWISGMLRSSFAYDTWHNEDWFNGMWLFLPQKAEQTGKLCDIIITSSLYTLKRERKKYRYP